MIVVMRMLVVASALSAGLAAAPRPDQGPLQPGATPSIQMAPSPASGDSAQPQMTVSSRGVLLSWVERVSERATLRFAERTSSGWTPASTVASGDDWFVNWADVPSVVRLDDQTLAAHWLQKSGPGTYAYDVRLAYSRDDGRRWSEPFRPHHDGLQREHGFASLFRMPHGGLGLVWLDGRAMAAEAGHGASAGSQGTMSVRYAAFDSEWRQTHEMPVDLRVCECCPTSAAMTAEGPIVAYRNRSEGEVRDIYVSRLEKAGWTAPEAAHADGWTIAACPVNGPMLDAAGADVALAWFTVKDDVGHAYAAFSRDAGRSFGAPIRLDDTAALGRVDIALLPGGTAVATWVEAEGARPAFRARQVDPSGRRSDAVTVARVSGARASGYPRVAYHGGEIVFAWTEIRDRRPVVSTAAIPARALPAP